MPTTTAQELLELAQQSVANGDYETALTYAERAQIISAGSPIKISHGQEEITFSAENLNFMIANLRTRSASNTGIETAKILYKRPDLDSDDA